MSIKIGDQLPVTPSLTSLAQDLKGKNLVLYFYPKDNTPGCTTEGKDFRDAYTKFLSLNTLVIGVSRDSETCHEKFKQKHEFPFHLIADTDGTLCHLLGVIKEKTMFANTFLGIERSTFLFDKTGKLVKEWRKVKVTGHVADVLVAVGELA